MSSCFEARSDDRIYAGILKRHRLVRCGRRANCDDVFRPALFQDFSCWNSEDEAKCWQVRVQ
jgi:hypothetical protein